MTFREITRRVQAALPESMQEWAKLHAAEIDADARRALVALEAELEVRAALVRKLLRKAGIPAVKTHGTQVRGYTKSSRGISLSVGQEYERLAFQNSQWRARTRRQGYKPFVRWDYPSELLVNFNATPNDAEAWSAVLREAMRVAGMAETRTGWVIAGPVEEA